MKVAVVPQIEGLTVEDFEEFAKKRPNLLRWLPNERDWNHIDKKWLCDVLFTKDSQGVQEMVNNAFKGRKERLEKSQNLMVEMKPEFEAALKKCISFSSKCSVNDTWS